MDADLLVGFLAGLLVATVASPVGVSGAVFLLPVQMSVLGVPNPAVTGTNLLYNVIATPGALVGLRARPDVTRLAGRLLLGTVPGAIVGSVLRVYVIPGQRPFKVFAGLLLLGLGVWLVRRSRSSARQIAGRRFTDSQLVALAGGVGLIGGIYGIGGGSLLSPLLVGTGMSVGLVAPAALATTFVTSLVGAAAYVVLSFFASGPIAPEWGVGVACGLGGFVGNYGGARIRPYLPEETLRLLLGLLAVSLGIAYLAQAFR